RLGTLAMLPPLPTATRPSVGVGELDAVFTATGPAVGVGEPGAVFQVVDAEHTRLYGVSIGCLAAGAVALLGVAVSQLVRKVRRKRNVATGNIRFFLS